MAVDNESLDLFESVGLEVSPNLVEAGKVYLFYGCVTDILEETDNHVMIEINFSIKAKVLLSNPEKIKVLKGRLFENGIVVCKVVSAKEEILADCETVIFGKQQSVMM